VKALTISSTSIVSTESSEHYSGCEERKRAGLCGGDHPLSLRASLSSSSYRKTAQL